MAETRAAALRIAGKVQGRRTTAEFAPPIDVPPGDWDVTLRTSWTEPAYLETDASWCVPGGSPASLVANGGAFGAKRDSEVVEAAERLTAEYGRAVRVIHAREDAVRSIGRGSRRGWGSDRTEPYGRGPGSSSLMPAVPSRGLRG